MLHLIGLGSLHPIGSHNCNEPALGFSTGTLHGSARAGLKPNAGSLQLRDHMGRSDPNPMGWSTLSHKTVKPHTLKPLMLGGGTVNY